jgi:curli biogenesis system outer membrane secretion channel CsgG
MRSSECKKVLFLLVAGFVILGVLLTSHAQAEGLRKVVAVSRFENKTAYGGGGQWTLDTGMADQLTDALIQSGQFTVLERETLGDVVEEQDMAASGRFQKSQSARTGKLTSAQILIKGTVTEFEAKSSGSGSGIGIGGVRIGSDKGEAHVGLIIRLIDTTTGEVLNSKRVEGKAQSGGFKLGLDLGSVDFGTDSFKKTPLGKASQIAIDNAVEYIASELRDLPFQGSVIKYDSGGEVFISAGQKVGAQVGNKFTVYSVGEELVDPVTGELLGSEEEEIGTVEIYQVKEKYSKAKIVSGGSGIKRGDIIRSQ